MNVLLINQYVPPDAAPTARLLGELAEHLRGQGHTVEFLGDRRDYRGRSGKVGAGGARLVRELSALRQILRGGFRRQPHRRDIVLALSSPPLLLVVAALIAWRQRARLAHWAMDLYPELAVALSPRVGQGFFSRFLALLMRVAYRRAALVVALDDDMREHLERVYGIRGVRVLSPWAPAVLENPKSETRNPKPGAVGSETESSHPWRWLYSGNLGRAHEWETLLEAQRILEGRGVPVELVFQGGGNARGQATERAETLGLQRCRWQGYVEEERLVTSLLAARVLIVTQRPETRGLLWPSKLAVISRLPRPLLFVGPPEGAIAKELHRRGNAGIFAPGSAASVADWIEARYQDDLQLRRAGDDGHDSIHFPIADASASAEGCEGWERWLAEVTKS